MTLLVLAQKRSIFEVPNTLVDYFVGREDVLLEVENVLGADVPRGPRILVLHGLGGQGKTQIALQYCERFRNMLRRPTDVFWIDASSKTAIESSLESLYGILEGNNGAHQNTQPRIEYVIRHFREATTDWLFVYDNFDNPAEMPNFKKTYVPVSRRGSVLITTRDKSVRTLINASEGKSIDLEGLDATSAVNLLLTRSDFQSTKDNMNHAGTTIKRLNSHPLALTQAAAYMKSSHIKLNDFLAHYNTQKAAILQQTPKLTQYTRNLNGSEETALNVFTTWNLSFEQLENLKGKDCIESKLLTFLAFFHYQDISESYFSFIPAMVSHVEMTKGKELLAIVSWSKALVEGNGDWSRWKFMEAITTLDELSLIQQVGLVTDEHGCWNTITLHPLVKDWILLRTGDTACRNNTISISILLSAILKSREDNGHFRLSLHDRQALQGHLIAQDENHKESFSQEQLFLYQVSTLAVYHDTQDWMADWFISQDNYEVAGQWLQRVFEGRKRTLGKEHPDTLNSIRFLVDVLLRQEKWDVAEDLARGALEAAEAMLGEENPLTFNSLACLANTLRARGSSKEAEELYRRARVNYEKVRGPEHFETLVCVQNLSIVMAAQGEYEDAVKLCRRALEGTEKALGAEHPETFVLAGNLASLMCDMDRYHEANALLERACSGLENLLGPDHLRTVYWKKSNAAFQKAYSAWRSEQTRAAEATSNESRRCADGGHQSEENKCARDDREIENEVKAARDGPKTSDHQEP